MGVLEGHLWDGSDFFSHMRVVTKRVVNWLLAIHAVPFIATPIPVDISKMSDVQLAWLEEASGK